MQGNVWMTNVKDFEIVQLTEEVWQVELKDDNSSMFFQVTKEVKDLLKSQL
jgi:hypothetical protein